MAVSWFLEGALAVSVLQCTLKQHDSLLWHTSRSLDLEEKR
jgi:hypothetical protein